MEVSQEILDLVPYSPGKPIEETQREFGLDRVFKLASNENPLGPSPKAMEAMAEAIKTVHRYPDASCYELNRALAAHYGLQSQNIAFGNGSNELLDLLIRIYAKPGDVVLTCESAFIVYEICAQGARARAEKVPLKEDLQFDLKALLARIEDPMEQTPKLVFIANPNNPTGTYVNDAEIREFMEAVKDREDLLVVLDEAYNEFVRAKDYPDSLKLMQDYSNLVVVRTLSKVYGLAGVRVGWLLGPDHVVDLVNRVRNPFNVNVMAQVAAKAALEDTDFLARAQEVNWQGLDYFYGELDRLGLKYWKSQGNFVLLDTGKDSGQVYQDLLKLGVIMRPVKIYGLPTHLRLSVGLLEENQKAIEALEKVLGS